MRGNGRMRQRLVWPAEQSGPVGQCCQWPGCAGDGLYPAPLCRDNLRAYRWFCLDHIRDYNAAWNYYAGMSEEQIEADIRKDTVWQRPSWPLGADGAGERTASFGFGDPFGLFGEADDAVRPSRPLSAEEEALVILDLRPPVTVAIVKARYKALVKQCHPDATGGDKAAEERFKRISAAYHTVIGTLTA
jgi:hypothetical protein